MLDKPLQRKINYLSLFFFFFATKQWRISLSFRKAYICHFDFSVLFFFIYALPSTLSVNVFDLFIGGND